MKKTRISSRGFWFVIPPLVGILLMLISTQGTTNTSLFLYFNRVSQYIPDSLWAHCTIFGDSIVSGIVFLCCIHTKRRLLRSFIFSALIASLFTVSLKHLFDIPRPAAVLGQDAIHIIGPLVLTHAFPSGHSATIGVLCSSIIFFVQSISLRWLLVLCAVLVGFSRIAVGAHWPMDVVGGLTFGWIASVLGYCVQKRVAWGISPGWGIGYGVVLFCLCTLLFAGYDTRFPQTHTMVMVYTSCMVLIGIWNMYRIIRNMKQVSFNTTSSL